MEIVNIEIRTLTGEDELASLEKTMPFPARPVKHRERYTAQQENKASYVIAWRNGIPVGHAFLSEDPGSRKFSDCPEIQDLFVMPEFRGGGIGANILLHAENVVKQHNGNKIGLAVALTNEDARRLYERLGYRNIGLTEITYLELDAANNWHQIREDCFYYIKPLS